MPTFMNGSVRHKNLKQLSISIHLELEKIERIAVIDWGIVGYTIKLFYVVVYYKDFFSRVMHIYRYINSLIEY